MTDLSDILAVCMRRTPSSDALAGDLRAAGAAVRWGAEATGAETQRAWLSLVSLADIVIGSEGEGGSRYLAALRQDRPALITCVLDDAPTRGDTLRVFASLMQALYVRERDGEGRHIESGFMQASLADSEQRPELRLAAANSPMQSAMPIIYGVYTCRDGAALLLNISGAARWGLFCRNVLGQPALAANHRNRDRCVRRALAALDRNDVLEGLATLEGIPNERATEPGQRVAEG
jgi:crotonobetainyl-CoA:carnitine CoA-transferase CaiB-like acyl-CoA transferase